MSGTMIWKTWLDVFDGIYRRHHYLYAETTFNTAFVFLLAVFPLLRLSPTPADDYNFNLDDNEGVCDLFDVQILNY